MWHVDAVIPSNVCKLHKIRYISTSLHWNSGQYAKLNIEGKDGMS